MQPSATMPDHPAVERFLRGSQKEMIYKNFDGIRHARNWASKHSHNSGCYMEISTGGVGSKAFAKITKTEGGFKEQTMEYQLKKEEYERLRKVVSA